MQDRRERMLRAALSAGVSTLVTATAHTLGGGAFPPALLLSLVFVAGVLICFALGGRRVALPNLVAAIGVTQVLLHAVFSLAGHTASTGTSGSTAPAGGHVHGAALVLPDLSATALSADALATGGLTDGTMAAMGHPGMVWAHVAAGLVTIVMLRVGAGSLRQLARSLVVSLVTALAVATATAVPHRPRGILRVVAIAPRRPAALLLAATRDLRGPPAPATI